MEIFAETEAISAGIPPSTVEKKTFPPVDWRSAFVLWFGVAAVLGSTQGLQKDGSHALKNTIESTDWNDECVVLDNRMRK